MKTIKKLCLHIFRRLLTIRKAGLYSYRNYLFAQLEFAGKSKIRSLYKKYVQDQLQLNDRQLKKVESKIMKYS